MPAIVSNITVPLLGLCDTGISGHLGSELYLAAIAVGSMMLNVVFWLFGFLRMGTTGFTASAFGGGDDKLVRQIFTASVILAILIGCLLILLRNPLAALLTRVISPDAGVKSLALDYFRICIAEAPAMLFTMAVTGWFLGMQSTFWPMVIAISVNVVNIILSFLLVFVFRQGFEGIAWGTMTANYIGAVIAIIAAVRFRKGKPLFVSPRKALDSRLLIRFFKVNTNLFVRSFCIICVSVAVTGAGARLGAEVLAVNAVIMQFFTLFSFFMDGFAFSGEALVGRWYGAGDAVKLRKSVSALLIWTVGMAAMFTVVYSSGGGIITDILTDEQSVRSGVRGMLVWICVLPMVSAWAFIYDGFYIGITDTGRMLLATAVATTVFFCVVFLRIGPGGITVSVESNTMLWTGFLSYLALRGLILALMWRRSVALKLGQN